MKQKVVWKEYAYSMSDIIKGKNFEEIIENLEKFSLTFVDDDYVTFIDTIGYDGREELIVKVFREESDKEYERRLKKEETARVQEEKRNKKIEQRERTLYKKLQKKYGEIK